MRFAEWGEGRASTAARWKDRCQGRILALFAVRRPHWEAEEWESAGSCDAVSQWGGPLSSLSGRLELQIGWASSEAAAVWHCEPPWVDGMDRQEVRGAADNMVQFSEIGFLGSDIGKGHRAAVDRESAVRMSPGAVLSRTGLGGLGRSHQVRLS